MLIGGIALGLIVGLLLGGRIERLADVRLRLLPVLFLAVIVRYSTEVLLTMQVPLVEALRVPLLATSYALLLVTLWQNRGYPGLALAFVGVASNALVITLNGGYMPVWMPAYYAAGFDTPLNTALHVPLDFGTAPEFFLHLGPFADLIPIPIPIVRNVASIGDLFISSGLAFFLFATVVRSPEPVVELDADAVRDRLGWQGSGLSSSLDDAAALNRPLVLGSAGVGMAGPSGNVVSLEPSTATGVAPPIPVPAPAPPPLVQRVREHPYVRLALNGSFSALWVGQLISLFGDRVHQIALIAFVLEVTDSPVAVALTFLVSTVPNLLFSPIAGAFVDRWDQKEVLVVSDILRAALVLLIPVAILINVWLAYPLVFLVTTVSIFFRPARVAILPRLVEERDLLAANSAMWVGETIGDLLYAVAGLFVVFLSASLPLAFWFDAATYLASALLLATIVVPPMARRATAARRAEAAAKGGPKRPSVRADLKAGWAFLRQETVLLANTIQGTIGQLSLGVITAVGVILARQLTTGPADEYRATWAFMETAIGVGNLVGGFVLGLISTRIRKGQLIILAYVAYGVQMVLLGAVDSIPIALGLLAGMGIANMAFVVPSQTLFQERTPQELMARVVSLRFAIVFGAMSAAMLLGGVLTEGLGVGLVIAAAGITAIAAGVVGLAVKELREA
jgi:MFS family permease